MEDALANDGIDMIGIGRPMCTDPAAPRGLLDGSKPHLPRHEDTLRIGPGIFGPHSPIGIIKAANGFGIQNWYCEQLRSLARTGHTNAKLGVFGALIAAEKYEKSLVKGLSR